MGRPLNPCGTYAAFRRHRRLKEDPCLACRIAADRHNKIRYDHRNDLVPDRHDPVVVEMPRGWRQKAACAESELDWFPEHDDEAGIAACVAVCEGCSVRHECLTAALAETTGSYDEVGVRGGLTPADRKSLRRMLRVSA